MYPSEAERILSRYRRIAPKPPPLLPSGSFGTTDPSSTCASVDSFTSSTKCKKSRKRKADDSLSGKALKGSKSMGSCLSNTGGAGSVTQGASDGTVPLGDPRSASQISHGSMVMGMEDLGEMSNGTRDASVRSSDARLAGYGTVAAPLYVVNAGKILQQSGVYMSPDVGTQQQHAFSMLHQKLGPGYNCTPGAQLEKDTGFMERAAAASATVLPDRPVSLSMCDVAGGRGIGYVGGGFTEMIRGITRLPTAADVQCLMQARVMATCGGQAATGGSSSCLRTSPTRYKEIQLRRSDPCVMPMTVSGCITGKPLCVSEAGQVHESDTELVTLSLLPNVPSKTNLPTKVLVSDGCLRAQPPIDGVAQPPPHGVHVAEKSWHHQMPSRFDSSVKVAVRDGASTAQSLTHGVTYVADYPSSLHQQVPSRLEPPGKVAVLNGSSLAHPSTLGVAHVAASHWHQQVSSQLEPLASVASRESCMSQVGVQLDIETSAIAVPPKKSASGLLMSSINTGINPFGVAIPTSPFMADGAVIDGVYLEQVYGRSTDPVLLLDDSNQVLWFNKSYDKALKSVSERLSGSSNPTGPYIDPLGHPTPLCSFILPPGSKPAAARATLWGFLKKLVIQENDAPLLRDQPGPPSLLQPGTGEELVKAQLARSDSNGRMGTVVRASGSRLTTVTLESITEFHMEAPGAVECTEAAEARLGSGSEPAFITDSLNRVRWVNASLKQMLGLANFESLTNASPRSSSNSGAEVVMPGFVEASTFVVCCTEKIPRSAWAFSCRVNLEWMRGNKRRSMTVPCDVSRLACTARSSDVNWVWQFDMAVSLCLNVPS